MIKAAYFQRESVCPGLHQPWQRGELGDWLIRSWIFALLFAASLLETGCHEDNLKDYWTIAPNPSAPRTVTVVTSAETNRPPGTNTMRARATLGRPPKSKPLRQILPTTGISQEVLGAKTDGQFGHTLSGVGDVYGDGFDCLLVGSFKGGTNSSGEIILYRGSPLGIDTNRYWSYICPNPGAEFGHQVEGLGDVNRDGYADFIVGATYDSEPGKPAHTGAAYVFLGGPDGPHLAPGWPVYGTVVDSKTGFSVAAAGDVNGDGLDDILVGAWQDSVISNSVTVTRVGRVFLYLGTPSGPTNQPAWVVSGAASGETFGYSVHGAGDLNNDGYADIVIGSHGYESSWKESGQVKVYYGGPNLPSQNANWTLQGTRAEQNTGDSVFAAGDVNGDGYADLLIGANSSSVEKQYEGAVLVCYGSPSGLTTNISWAYWPREPGMFLGHSVATAGDVNGDGYADVIVSAAEGYQLQRGEGVAFVFLGSRQGLSRQPHWTGSGGQPKTMYGKTVRGIGDFNGDGYDDVAIGQPGYTDTIPLQGRVQILYGSPTGLAHSSHWPAGIHPGWTAYGGWIALGGLAVSLLGFLISRRRYRLNEAAATAAARIREQAQAEERQRIAQDLHDQLGAELTEIAIASANARQQSGTREAGEAKLVQIEATAGRLVGNLSELVWVTKPTNDTLEATVAYTGDMVAAMLEKTQFQCTLDIPTQLPSLSIPYQLRHDLILAVKEVIHNVIKHSGGMGVRLALRCEDSRLTITIRDDGRWHDSPPEAGRGNGLPNLRDRLERHGGTAVIAGTASGTTVTLQVPLPAAITPAKL